MMNNTSTFSLKNSEIRYRRLFEAAQDGILILDAVTGMIEDVNPYLVQMLGYTREEFLKKKLWEVGAFKDIEDSKDAFQVLQEKEYLRYEDLPLKAKDGRLAQVEFVSSVYLVGDEKVIQCSIRDVSEHKRIIAALQVNEKKYHDLVNQSPDGMFIIGSSGNILVVNEVMCRELKFSEVELLSMNIWDIIPNQYLDQYRERLPKILEGLSLVEESVEYEVRGKDGNIHYVDVLSAPHYSGKEIVGFQGIARDITKLKQMEEALRKSEERYRLLVETLPDGVVVHSQGHVVFANPASAAIIGAIKPADLFGKPVIEFVHPDDREMALQRIQQSLSARAPLPLTEEKFVRLDGTLINVGVSGIPISYDGKPAMLTVYNDITERKQAEEALRVSEEKYRTLVEEVNDGFYVTDEAGVFTFVNPSLAKTYGFETPETLVGRKIMDFIAPENLAKIGESMRDAMFTSRVPEVINGQIVRPDGTRAFLEIKSTSIFKGDQIIGSRGIVRDITERKESEDALQVSESKFRSYIENAPLGLFVTDQSGRYVEVNKTASEMLGYTEAELLQLSIPDVLAPQSLEAGLKQFQKVVQDGFSTAEFLFRYKDGSQFWATVLAVKLSEDRFMSYCQDITERKLAEGRMRKQLAHLTALSSIDRTISASFDLKANLSEILSHVTKELGIDAADILILNSTSQMLEYGAGHGFRTKVVKTAQVRLGESNAGRVALERQLIQIPNLRDEPDNLLLTTLLKGEDFVCYYGVPLITKGQVEGVLEIYHRSVIEPDQEWFDFLNTLAGQAAIAIENATLFESLQRSNSELTLAYDAAIVGWSRALDLRDKRTEGHSQRVTELTVKLAHAFGFSDAELKQVRWGALLHDIGKMGVSDGILLKPGPLTDEEWVKMKKHPTFAYELLSPIHFLRLALDIPYCHHEKWDGTGYPRGLKGKGIPLAARIFAVVDVYDALTSDRPYRIAWTEEKTLEYIRNASGTHFDPHMVDAFMKYLNQV